jgi:23S rRNA (cytosine1962-C5)-methyltransferase
MNGSTDLLNRIRKNLRHRQRWARREGLDAYRIYDRDIPEFPYAIDRYADWLYVQEFGKPGAETSAPHVLPAIAQATETPAQRIVVQQRRRQRGSAQYARTDRPGQRLTIAEGGLRFEINLGRYLDTGLFLDHRTTRRWLGERSRGRSVLNLFAYTGSFTVYAAAGGARRTVSVDMSRAYQNWARRNLLLNDFDDFKRHVMVCEDVLAFLARATQNRARFDLIVLDPPSFSNSKRMPTTFDVKRDQVALLRRVSQLLAPGGELLFSNNRHGFKIAPEVASFAAVEEITQRTIPADFKQHPPHACWILRRLTP